MAQQIPTFLVDPTEYFSEEHIGVVDVLQPHILATEPLSDYYSKFPLLKLKGSIWFSSDVLQSTFEKISGKPLWSEIAL